MKRTTTITITHGDEADLMQALEAIATAIGNGDIEDHERMDGSHGFSADGYTANVESEAVERLTQIEVEDERGYKWALTPSDSTHVFVRNLDIKGRPNPYHIGQLTGAMREAADTLIASQRDEQGTYHYS